MQLNIETFSLPLSNEKRCITLHLANSNILNLCVVFVYFLAHLSRRLIMICPLTIVVVGVGVVVNFSHFYLLLQNHWANFNQTWHKASLGEGDSSLFK